ncbi:hypothetical protein GGR50DRAFT_659632 [Xylaria sp. CBS 124048]|nr:hypothetical protein GGR50DRAFT_659632 [Xylaria sp. CBS 124048]
MVNYVRMVVGLAVAVATAPAIAGSSSIAHSHVVKHSNHRPRADSTASEVDAFPITIRNEVMTPNSTTLSTPPTNVSAYLIGKAPDPADSASLLEFMAQHANDGTTSYYIPPRSTVPGISLSKAVPNLSWKVDLNNTSFKAPGTIISGRVYIVDGLLNFVSNQDGGIEEPDPHNPSDIASQSAWGLVELTYVRDPSNDNESLTVNLSFVDWVSLPLGMQVTFEGENGSVTQVIPGLNPDGLIKICDALTGMEGFWTKLCLRSADNKPLRVMSPQKYVSLYSDDALDYYEPYIDRIWSKYKGAELKINTQVNGPDSDAKTTVGSIVTCTVGSSDDILHCDNEAGDFERPVSRDIWGCDSGPFANPPAGAVETWSRARVRPRLCAAFTRSTLHLDAVQPSLDIDPTIYYKDNITNHYARLVHENLVGGMGYAFSYDDVSPNVESNSAGLISTPNPTKLEILINSWELPSPSVVDPDPGSEGVAVPVTVTVMETATAQCYR